MASDPSPTGPSRTKSARLNMAHIPDLFYGGGASVVAVFHPEDRIIVRGKIHARVLWGRLHCMGATIPPGNTLDVFSPRGHSAQGLTMETVQAAAGTARAALAAMEMDAETRREVVAAVKGGGRGGLGGGGTGGVLFSALDPPWCDRLRRWTPTAALLSPLSSGGAAAAFGSGGGGGGGGRRWERLDSVLGASLFIPGEVPSVREMTSSPRWDLVKQSADFSLRQRSKTHFALSCC